MRYYLVKISVFIFLMLPTQVSSGDITLNELFFDDSKPYYLKVLDALPESAIIAIGPQDAENTIIEFMDYFCGYCKKIHLVSRTLHFPFNPWSDKYIIKLLLRTESASIIERTWQSCALSSAIFW